MNYTIIFESDVNLPEQKTLRMSDGPTGDWLGIMMLLQSVKTPLVKMCKDSESKFQKSPVCRNCSYCSDLHPDQRQVTDWVIQAVLLFLAVCWGLFIPDMLPKEPAGTSMETV
ncbi:hypothetical protein ILYODFUR_021740 [Ilyodon furcidens]|uniref:Uncharacterized protein n=1 Tax=Ilyodon furcidens TaxID=33524 RepID=A0ABV0VG52_9TELE